MKLNLTVNLTPDVELSNYLEEDERMSGTVLAEEDEDLIEVSEADLIERFRSAVDDGDTSVDDLLNGSSDWTVTVSVHSDEPSTTEPWEKKFTLSEVTFINSIIEQIPEKLGMREKFVECLQKLAEAK